MGMLQGIIEFVPASLGITNQVHPVTSPLFSEMGAGQKLIHDLVEGIGLRVVQKGADLIGIRRQTDQIKIYTPDPSSLVGGQRRQNSLPGKGGLNEGVQGFDYGLRSGQGRLIRLNDGLPAPMLSPSLFQIEGGTADGTSQRWNRFFRPIGPTLDPTLEVTDHRSR